MKTKNRSACFYILMVSFYFTEFNEKRWRTRKDNSVFGDRFSNQRWILFRRCRQSSQLWRSSEPFCCRRKDRNTRGKKRKREEGVVCVRVLFPAEKATKENLIRDRDYRTLSLYWILRSVKIVSIVSFKTKF